MCGLWTVQHQSGLDGRPCIEGVRYKYTTSCSLPTYVSPKTLHVTHTLAHTYQFISSPWASALYHYKVSAEVQNIGWTSARNNERRDLVFFGLIILKAVLIFFSVVASI